MLEMRNNFRSLLLSYFREMPQASSTPFSKSVRRNPRPVSFFPVSPLRRDKRGIKHPGKCLVEICQCGFVYVRRIQHQLHIFIATRRPLIVFVFKTNPCAGKSCRISSQRLSTIGQVVLGIYFSNVTAVQFYLNKINYIYLIYLISLCYTACVKTSRNLHSKI